MNRGAILAGAAAIGGLIYLSTRGVAVPGRALSLSEVRALAPRVSSKWAPDIDPNMLVAIAWIESNFNPTAARFEPHLPDFSVGLMQTLVSTAQWVWDYLIVKPQGIPRPDFIGLTDPEQSMIFAALYLHWLRFYKSDQPRSEEQMVRGYNGGPGGFSSTATAPYWAKYQAARKGFGWCP